MIVGDGPLRDRVPEAVGFVPPSEMGAYYERAAVVCVPSRREGYGMTAREAMAWGRAVVATRVGGLTDLEGEGVTLVPSGEIEALRAAVSGALVPDSERGQIGAAARLRANAEFSNRAAARDLARTYERALRAAT